MMRCPQIALYALLFSLSLFPGDLQAQTRLDALQALQALQTKCESGITFEGYLTALDEAQSQLQAFFDSKESERSPEFSEKIERALIAWQSAFVIWKTKLEYKQEFVSSDHPTIQILFKTYPDARSLFSQNGQADVNSLITFFWNKADTRIAEAKRLISGKKRG